MAFSATFSSFGKLSAIARRLCRTPASLAESEYPTIISIKLSQYFSQAALIDLSWVISVMTCGEIARDPASSKRGMIGKRSSPKAARCLLAAARICSMDSHMLMIKPRVYHRGSPPSEIAATVSSIRSMAIFFFSRGAIRTSEDSRSSSGTTNPGKI
ncbi:hypothetical protein D3C72_1508270 [compost metagenome]